MWKNILKRLYATPVNSEPQVQNKVVEPKEKLTEEEILKNKVIDELCKIPFDAWKDNQCKYNGMTVKLKPMIESFLIPVYYFEINKLMFLNIKTFDYWIRLQDFISKQKEHLCKQNLTDIYNKIVGID